MSIRRSLAGAFRLPGMAWSFSRAGFKRRAKRFDPDALPDSLRGQVYVITGANSGIGLAAATSLAERHADIWMLCRNPERGQAARDTIDGLGHGRVELAIVDMSDLGSIRRVVSELHLERVDALVHNAGALFDEARTTPSGLDQTFALHVVGPELLTRALMPGLVAGAGRVIYVASGGMYAEKLCVADLLVPPQPFDGVRAYARAKRAQVVLAELWAQREPKVAFFAMHPGWADTAGVRSALPGFHRVTKRWLRSAPEGADTIVWLAASEQLPVGSGAFVFDRAEVSRHLLPGTQAPEVERERLFDTVESLLETRAAL